MIACILDYNGTIYTWTTVPSWVKSVKMAESILRQSYTERFYFVFVKPY